MQGFKWLSLARAAFMSLSADFESVTLSVRSKNHTRVGTRKITPSISPLASRPLQGVRSATQRQRWAVDLLTPLQPPHKPCRVVELARLTPALLHWPGSETCIPPAGPRCSPGVRGTALEGHCSHQCSAISACVSAGCRSETLETSSVREVCP